MAKKKKKQNKGGNNSDFVQKLKPSLNLHPETKQSIWAVILFSLALIVILSYTGKAGIFGEYFYKFFQDALGKGVFLIPLILILSSISLLKSIKRRFYFSAFFGSTLLLLSVLGIFDMVFKNGSGGYLGHYFAYPFNYFLGFWASLIIFLSFVIISFLIIMNIPLRFSRKADDQKDTFKKETAPVINSSAEMIKTTEDLNLVKEAVNGLKQKFLKNKKEAVSSNEKKEEMFDLLYTHKMSSKDYKFPPINLLEDDRSLPSSGDIKANANIIKRTLQNFGIEVNMAEVNIGPTVTQYTLKPAEGIKLSRITALNNDLALALAARSIRIEAPIPNKSLVGIEVPNKAIAVVGLKNIITSENFRNTKSLLGFCLGRDVTGNSVIPDLERMPHLLIAGATGSGKSVAIHALILSFLYRNSPETLKLILIDPKRVELSIYNGIPHLFAPVIVESKKSISALRWAIKEMERRYEILSEYHARDINSYNSQIVKLQQRKEAVEIMPYIVIVIDELADLMLAYSREVEALIVRLAQLARAVGIHLVISTQRPSVEVITGLIKANITSRIALQVPSQVDSRTILDMAGAEKLLGNGDMLFLSGETPKPKRVQGTFVSEREVKNVVEFLKSENLDYSDEAEPIFEVQNSLEFDDFRNETDDELYEEAKKVVIQMKRASASLLQRRLRVGYARAARLLDMLEENGIIGPGDGAKPREVYIGDENNI